MIASICEWYDGSTSEVLPFPGLMDLMDVWSILPKISGGRRGF